MDLPVLQTSLLACGEEIDTSVCVPHMLQNGFSFLGFFVFVLRIRPNYQEVSGESQIDVITSVVSISSTEMQSLATAAILSHHFQSAKSSYREDGDSLPFPHKWRVTEQEQ